jgi:Flp pilus assembly protein TadD
MVQGRTKDAMLLAGQLCELHPEQVQYHALHAWLRVLSGELRAGHTADSIITTLNRAVSERRDDLEIRMYRARVLKRLGRAKEAFRDFSFVASANPANEEAVREARECEKANA